jgi:SAM-dependent methyltransferase
MTAGDPSSAERARLRRVYAGYGAEAGRRVTWEESAGSRRARDRKWEAVVGLLGALPGIRQGSWVVDLGAGTGNDSLRIPEVVPQPAGIVAIDLLYEEIALSDRAGLLRPLVADSARLPLADGSAALVYQSTMLSSVLRADLRRMIFAEIRRVLSSGGIFLSYDSRFPNPWNRHTRPVRLAELRAEFAGWPQSGRSITGIPQVTRFLAPWSPLLCRAVESVPLLRSHRLFAASKPVDAPG